MNVETEQLRLKLIETQMALLQYQHIETKQRIERLLAESEKTQHPESSEYKPV